MELPEVRQTKESEKAFLCDKGASYSGVYETVSERFFVEMEHIARYKPPTPELEGLVQQKAP